MAQLHEDMVDVELHASRYAVFTHKEKVADMNNTVNCIYSNWLLRPTMRHSYGADLELDGPNYHPLPEKSVVHYAIPIESGG